MSEWGEKTAIREYNWSDRWRKDKSEFTLRVMAGKARQKLSTIEKAMKKFGETEL